MLRIFFTLLAFCITIPLISQLNGWQYRRTVTVTQPYDTVLTNFQVEFKFDSKALVDQGKLNPDLSDLRFSNDCAEEESLPYWIESGANTTETRVWIKVPLITPTEDVQFSMFYGKPGAPAGSDFFATWNNPLIITNDPVVQDDNIISPAQTWMKRDDSPGDTAIHFVDTLGTIEKHTWIIDEFDYIRIDDGATWTFDRSYASDIDSAYRVDDSLMHSLRFENVRKFVVNGTLMLSGLGYYRAPSEAGSFDGGFSGTYGFGPGGGQSLEFSNPFSGIPPQLEGNAGFGAAYGGCGGAGGYRGDGDNLQDATPYGDEQSYFIQAGSGGGRGTVEAGSGGGAFHLIGDFLELGPNGSINCAAENAIAPANPFDLGVGGAGGSGGGILIDAFELNSKGSLLAFGGNGGEFLIGGGGGSGGRIKIFHQKPIVANANVDVKGGIPGESNGGANFAADEESEPGCPGTYYQTQTFIKREPTVRLENDEFELPVFDFSVAPDLTQICEGRRIDITISEGFDVYTFNKNGAISSQGENRFFEEIDYQTGDIFDGIANYDGCIYNTGPLEVTVKPADIINIPQIDPVCLTGGQINLQEPIVGGEWNGRGIVSPTDGTFDPALTGVGTHIIQYFVDDGSACGQIGTLPVTVYAPDAQFEFDPEYCAYDENVQLIANTPGGIYSGDGFIDNNQGIWNPSGLPLGSLILSYEITDATGCTNSSSKQTRINGLPTATITGNTIACEGESIQLFGPNDVSYRWKPIDIIDGSRFEQTITVIPEAGANNIELIVNTIEGCLDTNNVTVNAFPSPVVNSPTQLSGCKSSNIKITATGATNYTWSPSDFLNTSNGASITSKPLTNIEYTVTGTDANGCKSTSITRITVDEITDLNYEVINPGVCLNDTLVVKTNARNITYSFEPDPLQFTDPFAEFIASQNLSVKITGTRNGCTVSENIDPTIFPLPSTDLDAELFSCINEETTFSFDLANTETFSIAPQNKILVNGQSFAFTSNTPGEFKYVLSMNSENGCVTDFPFSVSVNPAASFFLEDTVSKCSGDTAQLAPEGLFGTYQFLWEPQQFVVNPTERTAQFINTTDQEFTLTVSSGGVDCSSKETTFVKVAPSPDFAVPTNVDTCEGGVFEISAIGPFSYIWEGNGILSGASSNTVRVQQANPTNIKVTAVNSERCATTKTVNLGFFPPINVDLGLDTSICFGDSVLILVRSDYSSTEFEFNEPENYNVLTDSTALFFGTNTTLVTVTAMNNGCVETGEKAITVNPIPQLIAPDSVFTCELEDVQISATGGDVINWKPQPFVDNPFNDTVTFFGQGPGKHLLTITTNNLATNCINTKTVSVHSSPLPEILDIPNIEYCFGQSIELNPEIISSSGFEEAQWTPGNIFTSPSTARTTLISDQDESFSLTVMDNLGCENSKEFSSEVFPLPQLSISGLDNQLCPKTNYGLTASGLTNNQYTWEPSQLFTQGNTGDKVEFTAFAGNQIKLIGIDVNGCIDSISSDFDLYTVIVPQIQLSDDSLCLNDELFVDASLPSISQYNWMPSQLFSSQAGTSSLIPDFSSGNEFPFSMEFQDVNGCVDTAYASAYLHYTYPIIFGDDLGVCPGIQIEQSIQTPEYIQFDWNPKNQILSDPTNRMITISPSQPTTYSVNLVDINGCEHSSTIDIALYPDPIVDAGPDRTVYEGLPVYFDGISDAQNLTWYQENFDNAIAVGSEPALSFELTKPDALEEYFTIFLEAINEFGCIEIDTMRIKVFGIEQLTFVNAFSPNGDGKNERFSFFVNQKLLIESFTVFNRIGEKVYEQRNGNVDWDGSDQNQNPLPDGVYTFVLTYENLAGKEYQKTGNITLIR